jgi:hypothetical protein
MLDGDAVTAIIPGDGIDVGTDPETPTVSVDVTDIIGTGLSESGNNINLTIPGSAGEVIYTGTGSTLDSDSGFTYSAGASMLDIYGALSIHPGTITIDGTDDTIVADGGALSFVTTDLETQGSIKAWDRITTLNDLFATGKVCSGTASGNEGTFMMFGAASKYGVLRNRTPSASWNLNMDDIGAWTTTYLASLVYNGATGDYDLTAVNPATISGAAAGLNTQVQYNNGGAFAGDSGFTYISGTDQVIIGAPPAIVADTNLDVHGNACIDDTVNVGNTLGIGFNHIGGSYVDGTFKIYDDDGDYVGQTVGDTAANALIDWSNVGAWTTTYLLSFVNPSPGLWVATKVDPTSITPDTNTDNESIEMCGVSAATVPVTPTAASAMGSIIPIVLAGTITHADVCISTWTVNAGADTVTFTLYVDGNPTDAWTQVTNTLISDSGANISEAVTQGGYIQIYAQISTVVGTPDVLKVTNWVVNNRIL